MKYWSVIIFFRTKYFDFELLVPFEMKCDFAECFWKNCGMGNQIGRNGDPDSNHGEISEGKIGR